MGKRKGDQKKAKEAEATGSWREQQQQGNSEPQQQQSHPGGAHQRGPPQQQQPQAGGAWQRGPPQQQQPQAGGSHQRGPPQQQQPQAGGAWQRGPPQQQPQEGSAWQRGPPQQQYQQAGGDGKRGPPQQQQSHPGGAHQRGPPQQQQPQAGGAWQRGPPQQQQPQAGGSHQRGPPQQQQPQAGGSHQRGPPQQQQPQAGGAWQRGPPQQQQPQAGGSHQRGPPQQQQPQAGGAWQRGPPQQQQPQAGGSHQRGPPQQQQPQAGGAWQRGPPQQQYQQAGGDGKRGPPQQQQPQAGGSHQRGPPQQQYHAGGDGKAEPSKKAEKTERKEESGVVVRTLEFAPRIFAQKKSGRELFVFANFFRLTFSNPNMTVYRYTVTIEPDKPKYLIRDVWNKYVSMVYPGRLTAFDGKNAFSKEPLSDSTEVTVVSVKNPEREGMEKEFKVSIEFCKKINWACFDNYRERMLQSRSMKVLPEEEMAVLGVILRNTASDRLVRCRDSFFPLSSNLRSHSNLSDKLTLRLGYFQSAFLGYKPFLNFDISHKPFYADLRVSDMENVFRNRFTGVVEVDEMNRFLRTVKVEYQLPNDASSRRVFRVNKLVGSANEQTFKKDDETRMSVAEYFATEKKCPIRRPDLPCLWVGPTQKSIYVPMEFCKIVPDQVYRGLLEPDEQRKMVQGATSDARRRKNDIYELFQKSTIRNDPLLKEFGIQVATEMEKVPARVLDPPQLRTSRSVRVRDGVWSIQDFLEPVTLDKWCILNLDKKVRRENVRRLQDLLKDKGNAFNMRISDPVRDPIDGDPSFAGLKKAFSQLRGMKMVFVIISNAKGIYSRIKAICETQESILTQCIKSRTIEQDGAKLSTTVQNILLKVNAKLGGTNHCLDKNSAPPCLEGKVMVIGADVTHPSPGMKIPSVAAVTVSCDPEAFQYGTTVRVQPKGEMIKDMQDIISIHLKKFRELRQSYPEKIIFFRDGVSEGELEKVYKGELAAVRNACSGLCQPKITFVVVQKRHHTRLFPAFKGDETGRNYNVPVGTCVDSVIVHPRDLDFYLVSHASILGTARPTRYRLLHNDNNLTDDEVETLAYYLCHLFSRCNRSVSYPSPTYNAHLAAARVRAQMEGLNLTGDQDIDYIKKQLKDNMSNTYPMYFV